MNKNDVVAYYESQAHEDTVAKILKSAYKVIDDYSDNSNEYAIVLDIDETSLNHYEDLKKAGFPQDDLVWDEIVKMTDCKPIKSTLKFYETCIDMGYKVFFVSARYSSSLNATKEALRNAGYSAFENIFVFPEDIQEYRSDEFKNFKSERRAYIESLGIAVLISIGDQPSDLIGGFTKCTCELPNYLYGKKSFFAG